MKRLACRQRPWLVMAFSACALQVLGLYLPSLVICYRTDRPPQIEFFADSCSCRQTASHSGCQHAAPGAPCLEAGCTDIQLVAPAAITAAASRHHAPDGYGRPAPANERPVAMTGATIPRPASHRRGRSGAAAPPLLAAMAASSRLRC
ncbi:MAG: hypothetical protein PHX05_04550 [Acidobacteriota bacterium]|nr:hypothetical protein [Acidobacteriota bacterium]